MWNSEKDLMGRVRGKEGGREGGKEGERESEGMRKEGGRMIMFYFS